MKLDAHYYAVLGFSRACGFKKDAAHLIAYTSQFVDDAIINHITINNGNLNNIDHVVIDNKASFFGMSTCHSYTRIKTFNYSSMINNTTAFHFVPRCEGVNFPKKLRCSEESQIIVNLLEDAKKEDSLIKLGLVLHPYADTFSHQGFSGILSKVNDIKNIKTMKKIPWNKCDKWIKFFKKFWKSRIDKLLDSAMPAYGHGQALEYPDLPFLKWSYEYDFSDEFSEQYQSSDDIDNTGRFTRAFKKIQQHLSEYLNSYPQYRDPSVQSHDFDGLFNALTISKTNKGRERNWRKILVEKNLFSKDDKELKYLDDQWLKEAFANYDKKKFNERFVEGAVLANNFVKTNWYQYYLAVDWYKERFFHYCNERNLKIPK